MPTRSTAHLRRCAPLVPTLLAFALSACGHARAADTGVDVTYALEPFRLLPYNADEYCADRHVAAAAADTEALGPRAVLAMAAPQRAARAQAVMDASCALVGALREKLESARAEDDSAEFSCLRADWARAEVNVWSTREHLEALRALSDGDDNGVAAEESGILEMLYLRSREIVQQSSACATQTLVRESFPARPGPSGVSMERPGARRPGGA